MIDKTALLELIAEHTGHWGWYQLERFVNPRDLVAGTTVKGLVTELIRDGLVEQLPTEPMPYYAVTELGRERIGFQSTNSAE